MRQASASPSTRYSSRHPSRTRPRKLSRCAFLDYRPVFGDLGANARLRAAFVASRASLVAHGARATVSSIADL
jgi:hypothetical protein